MDVDFLVHSFVALFVGAFIGLERQWRQRLVGLRTNALVALGASLYVSLAVLEPKDSSPTRIAAQVVSGIGFLGAGIIFKEGFTVKGLNTAATLWCSGAVGVLSGSGYIIEAIFSGVVVITANLVLRPIGVFINQLSQKNIEVETTYRFTIEAKKADESFIRKLLIQEFKKKSFHFRYLETGKSDRKGYIIAYADVQISGRNDEFPEDVVQKILKFREILQASWEIMEQTRE